MKFPVLKESQVVVTMADGATGHILNEKGELYKSTSTEDNFYLLFDNINDAKSFIKKRLILNDKIEFIIYGKNQIVLDYIEATHWSNGGNVSD